MRGVSRAIWFKLAEAKDRFGLSCDESGLFLAGIPLVARTRSGAAWTPRPLAELNVALSAAYGLPIDLAAKAAGLAAVARALTTKNLPLAQSAALNLRLPDPPRIEKSARTRQESLALAAFLHQCGILDLAAARPLFETTAKRDVSNEPRIPRGQPGGGQWTTDGATSQTADSLLQPTQEVIPFPLGPMIRPIPGIRPLPPGIDLPVPLPVPREGIPWNPYPDRPECEKEWQEAWKACDKLYRDGKLGPKSRWGKDIGACLRGMVSQDCGGNPVA